MQKTAQAGQIETEFSAITEYWSPRVVAELNGQYMKLAKVKGELVWHAHSEEDELFLIHKGCLTLKFRDRSDVVLKAGEFYVVPKGVEHFPVAEDETWVILLEPAATKHTGDTPSARSKSIEAQRAHLNSST